MLVIERIRLVWVHLCQRCNLLAQRQYHALNNDKRSKLVVQKRDISIVKSIGLRVEGPKAQCLLLVVRAIASLGADVKLAKAVECFRALYLIACDSLLQIQSVVRFIKLIGHPTNVITCEVLRSRLLGGITQKLAVHGFKRHLAIGEYVRLETCRAFGSLPFCDWFCGELAICIIHHINLSIFAYELHEVQQSVLGLLHIGFFHKLLHGLL